MSWEDRLESRMNEAHRQHGRQRKVEEIAFVVGVPVFLSILGWFGNSVDPWIFLVGVLVLLAFLQTKWRLKAMQLRLAEMHDEIDKLRGNRPADHMLRELTCELSYRRWEAVFDAQ